MMEFVSWDDDIPIYYGKLKKTCSSHHQPEYPYWEISEHFFTQVRTAFDTSFSNNISHPDCQGLQSPSRSERVSTKEAVDNIEPNAAGASHNLAREASSCWELRATKHHLLLTSRFFLSIDMTYKTLALT